MARGSMVLGTILIVLLCVLSFLVGMIVRGRRPIPIGPGEPGPSVSYPPADPDPSEAAVVTPGRIRIRVLTCGRTDQELSHAMEVIEVLRARDYPDVDWAEIGDRLTVFVGDFDDRAHAQRWLGRLKEERYAGGDAFREAVLAEVR